MAARNLVLLGNHAHLTKCVQSIAPITSRCMSKKASDSWVPKEKETHTGQKWEKDDYRLVRFIDKPKQINPRFAIDMIENAPPECTESRVVACDGGGGPLGHPKVYINLDKPGNHSCGYCGLRFFKDDHHH